MVKFTREEIFKLHLGGKIATQNKINLKNYKQLSIAYTPGVAEVCKEIAKNPSVYNKYTISDNTIAVITDGTAVLGLGDIGPKGGMPVMEGKCMLFKAFGGVNAFPILIDSKDTEEIIKTIKMIAPTFGGINLEDISSPRCFEIEERLIKELDIPVFHDDQHGTAVVVFAGLINALKKTGKKIENIRIVINGTGAAGISIAKLLYLNGARHIIGCDTKGILSPDRTDLNKAKIEFLKYTCLHDISGTLTDAMADADVFIGVSGPGALTRDMVKTMARKPIVFAMANPTPEIMPEEIKDIAAVIATGRSDYPNQINNVLCFPGLFKGLLEAKARKITPSMLTAASHAIASLVTKKDLAAGTIIPSVFDKRVAPAVAKAVKKLVRK